MLSLQIFKFSNFLMTVNFHGAYIYERYDSFFFSCISRYFWTRGWVRWDCDSPGLLLYAGSCSISRHFIQSYNEYTRFGEENWTFIYRKSNHHSKMFPIYRVPYYLLMCLFSSNFQEVFLHVFCNSFLTGVNKNKSKTRMDTPFVLSFPNCT